MRSTCCEWRQVCTCIYGQGPFECPHACWLFLDVIAKLSCCIIIFACNSWCYWIQCSQRSSFHVFQNWEHLVFCLLFKSMLCKWDYCTMDHMTCMSMDKDTEPGKKLENSYQKQNVEPLVRLWEMWACSSSPFVGEAVSSCNGRNVCGSSNSKHILFAIRSALKLVHQHDRRGPTSVAVVIGLLGIERCMEDHISQFCKSAACMSTWDCLGV